MTSGQGAERQAGAVPAGTWSPVASAVDSQPTAAPVPPESRWESPIHSVAMEVHTEEAGPVHVRVTLADQTVRTNITTLSPEVRSDLLRRQEHLETGLQGMGLELGEFHVDLNRQESGARHQFDWISEFQGEPDRAFDRSREGDTDRTTGAPRDRWMRAEFGGHRISFFA
jgi:hypothetical protein